MIKFMVAALWISIATTGAMLYSFQSAQQPEGAAEAEPTAFHGLDYVQTGIISVPVFDHGRVYGYFLARLVFTAEGKRLATLKLPAEALLADQVYTHLYANPEIDFTKRDDLDINAFRESIRAGVNERLGEPLIHEVLVEQIDFLPKDEAGSSKAQPAAAVN
ncbi:hypothetical protein FY036_19885 [Mesorhizobium microcysteis]|uniref:Flagellar basal body-associated protein FliL n=1 Tax=Neoaquamicrobium microcysteis TaxID=2682781 RepID=A0A5D4GPB5_9HYPH|nr:hypothetical protein [Mesorhizobium microcysteis]TYR30148.1 hypothetical protein FY036_19885 [Mesorhizobium microcysteis]